MTNLDIIFEIRKYLSFFPYNFLFHKPNDLFYLAYTVLHQAEYSPASFLLWKTFVSHLGENRKSLALHLRCPHFSLRFFQGTNNIVESTFPFFVHLFKYDYIRLYTLLLNL